MASSNRTSSIKVSPIDLEFRPKTYFAPFDARSYVWSHVKGVFRREAVPHSLQSGQLYGELESIVTPGLPEPQRTSLSKISPALLGGEFLPPFKNNEVEIARITLRSVTYNVTAVFAYFARGQYYYRVVGEYDGEAVSGPCRRVLDAPLSLGELTHFIERAWPLAEADLRAFEGDLEEALDFFWAESAFYPDLDAPCRERVRKAYREMCSKG